MSMALMLGFHFVAGCGNSEGGQSQDAGGSRTESSASAGTEGNTDTGASSSAAADVSDEDMAGDQMVYMPLGSMPKGLHKLRTPLMKLQRQK